jgi:hypothetical protein
VLRFGALPDSDTVAAHRAVAVDILRPPGYIARL